MALLDRLRPIWPVLALLASAAMLATAHAFQRFGGLYPCPLCLDQRNWHWAVVGVSALSFAVLRVRPNLARWMAALIGLVFIGSMGMGLYHVAVEQHWVVATCDARIDADNLSFDLDAPVVAPKCDEIAWQMFGISMAGYNAIVSALLAVASFAIALSPEREA